MAARFKPESLALAASLIALGLVWTLGNLGRVDALYVLRTWWPASLVFWGLLELLGAIADRRDGRPS